MCECSETFKRSWKRCRSRKKILIHCRKRLFYRTAFREAKDRSKIFSADGRRSFARVTAESAWPDGAADAARRRSRPFYIKATIKEPQLCAGVCVGVCVRLKWWTTKCALHHTLAIILSFFLSLSLSLTDTNTYTQRESVRYVDDAWTQQCIPVCGCLCLYIIYTWSACHVCVRERRYYVHELERERVRVCVECLSSVLFLIKGVYLCVCSLCSELETSTIIRTNKRSNLPVSIFYSFKNHFWIDSIGFDLNVIPWRRRRQKPLFKAETTLTKTQ